MGFWQAADTWRCEGVPSEGIRVCASPAFLQCSSLGLPAWSRVGGVS